MVSNFSKYIAYCLLVLCSFTSIKIFATNQLPIVELKCKQYTSKDGLSQSTVNCIFQDHFGFMWFGTQEGVDRWDGYNFKQFTHKPNDPNSLSEYKNVEYLAEDELGYIWAVTKSGINWIDAASLKVIPGEKIETLKELHNNSEIYTILYDKQEHIMWLGTSHGTYRYHIYTKKLENINLQMNKVGKGVKFTPHTFYNHNTEILIGTNKGLFRYNKKTKSILYHYFMNLSNEEYISQSNEIISIERIEKNIFWLASKTLGITEVNLDKPLAKCIRYAKNTKSNNELSTNKEIIGNAPYTIKKIDHNKVLILMPEGIMRYNTQEHQFSIVKLLTTNNQLINNGEIKKVFVDNANNVFLGTGNSGFLKYNFSDAQFYQLDFLKGKPVFGITEDKNKNVWFATEGYGLYKYEPKTNSFENYIYPRDNEILYGCKENFIYSVTVDKENNLWIGSDVYGLNVYSINKKKRVHLPFDKAGLETNTINSAEIISIVNILLEDNNKWISCYTKGIYKIDYLNRKTHLCSETNFPTDKIYKILKVHNNEYWLATEDKGVIILDGLTNNYISFESKYNIKLNAKNVNCIQLSKDSNTVWFATDNGLRRFILSQKKIKSYHMIDGLPAETIYGIEEDDNHNLWISTTNGLSKFNPNAKRTIGRSFTNYSAEDGLQENEFNILSNYTASDGRMYFGGVNGANYFHPKDIQTSTNAPFVRITAIKKNSKEDFIFDSAAIVKKYIKFSSKEAGGVVRFEFVALSYKLPEKNLYQYKLDGFDKNWSEPSTDRYKEYTNLEGGAYTFKVRACNSDGVWNDQGVSVKIEVDPVFYKRKDFIIVSIILVVLGVIGYVRWRTRKLNQEKQELENAVAERTKELAEKNKDITSSIQYAKRIQDAILPNKAHIFKSLPNAFIYYKPKDIVSGDFYWFAEKNDCKIIAVVDCTGHGVPGAFMSMIGNNLLNQIVVEKGITEPAKILDMLNEGVRFAIKNGRYDADTTDGMDVALCKITGNTVNFAGAYRPLLYIQNGELKKIEANKFPIGGSKYIDDSTYTNTQIEMNEGEALFMFSDGYGDQFGGPQGKKFTLKRMQQLFLDIYKEPARYQKILVENTMIEWKGDFEQVDDILVIGVKF